MALSFFEALEKVNGGIIGRGIRWASPWIKDGNVRRQFVIARAARPD
jgi:hypothetical protein